MAIPQFNSFRRYTPPTCTLEIYHPQPFWARWRDQSFPPLFSFQLHFDDPRLAKDDRISIIGDRNLLEKLRIKLQRYINKYLKQSTITNEELSSEISTTAVNVADNMIHFSRQSSYSHLFYYQSFAPHSEIIEIVLNNTQLLDLINALEAYHWDATQVKVFRAKKNLSPRLGIALFAMVATASGFWWWQHQQSDNLAAREENVSSKSENSVKNFPAVIPPSPLDTNKIPETVVPEIPPELINQKTLPPPPIVAKTPNSSLSNQSPNNTIASSNSRKKNNDLSDSNSSTVSIVPNNSTVKNNQSQSSIKQQQKISISPLTSLPTLSSGNSQSSTSSANEDQENSIATLSPSLQKKLSNNSIDNIKNNSSPNLKQNISYSNSSKTISQNISAEVKQYFQGKWQVPDNLTQSIEYRLQVEKDGSLSKVTPIGQVATIFLKQTPIPENNEIITSPFTELSYLTVRLILSPNGGVKTFAE